MTGTRENILDASLRLFSRDGYEAVSVSMIAAELGVTKGALYRHFKNKRDIFDCLVAKMYQIDAERSVRYGVPDVSYEACPAAYRNVALNHIWDFTMAQFTFWTEDDFACQFRRMLILEQYRNAEMAELYQNCVVAGPVAYMEHIFAELISDGVIRQEDPKQLALAFYAPLFLLISMFDHRGGAASLQALLQVHIDQFFRHYSSEESRKHYHESH